MLTEVSVYTLLFGTVLHALLQEFPHYTFWRLIGQTITGHLFRPYTRRFQFKSPLSRMEQEYQLKWERCNKVRRTDIVRVYASNGDTLFAVILLLKFLTEHVLGGQGHQLRRNERYNYSVERLRAFYVLNVSERRACGWDPFCGTADSCSSAPGSCF